jgi:hypothetical protein
MNEPGKPVQIVTIHGAKSLLFLYAEKCVRRKRGKKL